MKSNEDSGSVVLAKPDSEAAFQCSEFTVEQIGEITLVTLRTPDLREPETIWKAKDALVTFVKRSQPKYLIVDCKQVKFVSTMFVGMFVSLRKCLSQHIGDPRLCGLAPHIHEALTIFFPRGELFAIFDGLDDAWKSCRD